MIIVSVMKRSPLKKTGKIGKQWIKTRKEWFKLNSMPPYACYICGVWLTPYEMTLDHIQSRSRHPELRFELSNLAPACWTCNSNKGSLSLEQYKAKLNG